MIINLILITTKRWCSLPPLADFYFDWKWTCTTYYVVLASFVPTNLSGKGKSYPLPPWAFCCKMLSRTLLSRMSKNWKYALLWEKILGQICCSASCAGLDENSRQESFFRAQDTEDDKCKTKNAFSIWNSCSIFQLCNSCACLGNTLVSLENLTYSEFLSKFEIIKQWGNTH